MRVDHHAYRKATRVAGFGLFVQAAIGLILLLFGVVGSDTVFQFASYYVLGGLLVWLSLIVIFYQHTQERLEALEEDELAAGGFSEEGPDVDDDAADGEDEDDDEPPEGVQIRNGSEDADDVTVIVVPLRYQQRVLGTLSLYIQGPMDEDNAEAPKLFDNVGKHLGMAAATAKLDEESRKLTLMRERNSLAHELHDSLAQTLAGLGFQVRMLADTLSHAVSSKICRVVPRITTSTSSSRARFEIVRAGSSPSRYRASASISTPWRAWTIGSVIFFPRSAT